MYDWIERMDAAAEDAYFKMLQPDGRLKCECGSLFDALDGNNLDGNPYSMPVCPKCIEKANYGR